MQEISCHLWNHMVYFHAEKNPSLVPTMSQTNPIHISNPLPFRSMSTFISYLVSQLQVLRLNFVYMYFYVCNASNTPHHFHPPSPYRLRFTRERFALQMVTSGASETLRTTHKAMWRHRSEAHCLNICRSECQLSRAKILLISFQSMRNFYKTSWNCRYIRK
jgi:hypothetical protein